MFRINPNLSDLSLRSKITLVIIILTLVSIPAGIYLAQKQLFLNQELLSSQSFLQIKYGIIKVNWDTKLASAQNNVLQFYFPPTNWTDGIDPQRYVSNSAGDNVKCTTSTIGTVGQLGAKGYAKCSYTDDSSIKREGQYRLWVDSFIPTKDNSRSVNTYITGTVNCGN